MLRAVCLMILVSLTAACAGGGTGMSQGNPIPQDFDSSFAF